ncbi:MAG: response regulator transcription factor [Pseudomonadota bacterium]
MSDTKNPVIYVVDDDAPVRESLALLIRSMQWPVHCYADAAEFLENFDPELHSCLILDIRMPGMSGLELQEELIARGLQVPIVFLTGHGDVPMAVKAIKLGAIDFLEKPFNDQALLDCINKALSEDLNSRSRREQTREVENKIASLTPREREVMERVITGQANKVIAVDLGLSERTVEIHRSKVMSKMGARSLADLVRLALEL